jgi:hypothetical protein
MTHEKLSLRDALRKNKLITFALALVELPVFLVAGTVVAALGRTFGNNPFGYNGWVFEPYFYIGVTEYIIHFILYVCFRFIAKKRIHISVLTALLVIFVILAPFMVHEFFHRSIALATLATDIGLSFIYQAIMFGVFTGAITLIDRHTELRDWQKILTSFAASIPIGWGASWVAWTILMKLYFYLRTV